MGALLPDSVFHNLTPENIIDLIEGCLGIRLTNLCRPLNSYINRVYELQTEDQDGLVVKFYRPGRWSRLALQDEHDFLAELVSTEIPVIAPLTLKGGATLGQHGDTFFTVFSKKGGRSYDEYSEEQWLELGRLLGRVHDVGARRMPKERIVLTPDAATRQQVNYILASGSIPVDLVGQYQEVASGLIAEISPLFTSLDLIRIHGDCHFANLIYRPNESFFLIDLDDMVVGPPVHDLWMLLPGHLEDSLYEMELFLEGYETFRPFDRRTLALIEPLRAMRFIHFTAWCVRQLEGGGFISVVPDFGSRAYWQGEIDDLVDQRALIKESAQPEKEVGELMNNGERPF